MVTYIISITSHTTRASLVAVVHLRQPLAQVKTTTLFPVLSPRCL
jgi:hypothetical protein